MTAMLAGRVAVVTGASRGIGATTAVSMAREGAAVTLAARSTDALAHLAQRITADGGRALAVPTDVGDETSVHHMVEQTLDTFGRLDIAVNGAAAGSHPPTPLADIAVTDFDANVAVSLRGVFLAMKFEIRAMLDGGGGAIVNIASTAGLDAVGGLGGYVSAKFGVVGLTRTAALDYAGAGIRVNALAPGPILTEPLIRAGERAQQVVAGQVPLGRLGRPEDVAAAAVWLCSEQAGFITGATLLVDGGRLAGTRPWAPGPRRPDGAAM